MKVYDMNWNEYTEAELEEALRIISDIIVKCEKMISKFTQRTSQHTLLRNRIKALYICQALFKAEDISDKYTKDELAEAQKPISSIISKCEKAKLKCEEGTFHSARLQKIIAAMLISKAFLEDEINKRS